MEIGTECRDIDFSNITDLSNLFYLKEKILLQDNVYFIDPNDPDLLVWNTSNVFFREMFYYCKNFNKPVKLDTSRATSFEMMFYMCKKFNQSIYFTDISNVVNMSGMFMDCENFNQPVDFDTSNVTNMNSMFFGCKNFNQAIDFNASNVNDVLMFKGCENLNSEIKLKNIGKNVDKVKTGYLFDGCDKLELENIQLDITDCDKLEGENIYKGMNIDEFCDFIKIEKNINVSKIINDLRNLMFP